MRKRISVIILNYNGKNYLKGCLDSVLSSDYSPLEVTVVDNASIDGSADFIKASYPEVKVIQSSKNWGFAKAVNLGIKATEGEYIALLNNDTVVLPNWLSELQKAAQAHPEIGFCATKMISLRRPQFIDSAGIIYNWKGKAYDRDKGEKDSSKFNRQEYIFGACNGAAFYRREAFEKVGLLDENFFLVGDDIDFSFRAQLMGIKCLYIPTAVVEHAGGGTVVGWTAQKAIFSARHHIYIIIKNFPAKFILLNLPQIIIERLRNLSGLLKNVPIWQILPVLIKTYGEVIIKFPEMLRKRRIIQRRRVVSDEYLRSLIRRADFSAN